ncbi:Protein CBG10096 [Caenorhabditis briggsae]|uniref:Protein CBG10096 n=2 Tax=Caenorhabditis briggsae TaxID=6238 RepID=A8XAD7_CAEBR|nr:Protein CBG10096 [Caenorhabditis briggsae]CAP29605.2 Protein CBG10096 [Caenorhabditis briggsae]
MASLINKISEFRIPGKERTLGKSANMLSRLFLLLSFVILCHSIVSEISHRFLHRDPEYEGRVYYEPLYTSKDFRLGGSAQLSPLYEMTNSHLLNLADLLRKRTETQTPY